MRSAALAQGHVQGTFFSSFHRSLHLHNKSDMIPPIPYHWVTPSSGSICATAHPQAATPSTISLEGPSTASLFVQLPGVLSKIIRILQPPTQLAVPRLLDVDDPLRHGRSKTGDYSPLSQPTTIIIFGTLLKEPHLTRPLKPQLSPSLTVVQLVLLSASLKDRPVEELALILLHPMALAHTILRDRTVDHSIVSNVFSLLPSDDLHPFLPCFVIFSNSTPLVISCICFLFCRSTFAVLTKKPA